MQCSCPGRSCRRGAHHRSHQPLLAVVDELHRRHRCYPPPALPPSAAPALQKRSRGGRRPAGGMRSVQLITALVTATVPRQAAPRAAGASAAPGCPAAAWTHLPELASPSWADAGRPSMPATSESVRAVLERIGHRKSNGDTDLHCKAITQRWLGVFSEPIEGQTQNAHCNSFLPGGCHGHPVIPAMASPVSTA
jgi:hypothetical protein